MRLTELERQAIRETIAAHDAHAEIWLFGSRADDSQRGGDIDLMVLSGRIGPGDKLDILGALHQRIGEQRIDLVVEKTREKPFTRIALAEGVRL